MTKRDRADPRQLCFLFERPGVTVEVAHVGGTDTVGAAVPSPAEPSVVPAPATSRAPVPLSGADPKLTKLCVTWLEGLGMADLGTRLTVVWNRRFASAAGVARYGPCRIELNPALVNFEGEIERTLRHELAHLVARFRHPKRRIRPHGSEWREACADLGIPGEPIYHSLPFNVSRRKRHHAYRCAGCQQVVTRVRPLKGQCACHACCKRYNGGRYDPRFKLEKIPVPQGT